MFYLILFLAFGVYMSVHFELSCWAKQRLKHYQAYTALLSEILYFFLILWALNELSFVDSELL